MATSNVAAAGGLPTTEAPNHKDGTSSSSEPSDWSQMMNQIALTLDSKEYVETFWKQQTRPDGRLFSQARPTLMQKGPLHHTAVDGSALVTLGDTRILASVTCGVGQSTTSPPRGDIAVTLSFPCGQEATHNMAAAPLEAYLERLWMETIPLEQLSLSFLKDNTSTATNNNTSNVALLAMRLQISLQVLHAAGNLWDATILASVAALVDTTLPNLHYNATTGRVERQSGGRRSLQLPILPLPLTLGVYHVPSTNNNNRNDTTSTTHWMVDPTLLEEASGHLASALTVVVNGANDKFEIVSLEYSGASPPALSVEQHVLVALHMAQARAQELRVLLLSEPETS
mmetsp:Transcript_12884/g.26727  ORF Transcript_12884/g.26727 Transcript_12884/m.26727 type:complete len:342 (-) Transcript_12884:732-1757(-)